MTTKGTVLTRKDMKAPDKFQSAAGHAAEWATTRQKQLVYLAVAVVALVAIAVGVDAVLGRRRDEAGGLLYSALSAADGSVAQAPIPGASAPTFASAEEQQKAIVSRAQVVKDEFASSTAGITAALAVGDAQLRLGSWDQAIAAYEQFLSRASRDDSLRFAALEGLAFAQEGKGDLEKAAQAFERLGSESPMHADRAALERARVLARAGKVEEAKKILAAFPEQHKSSQLLTDAQERLSRLGGK